MKIKTKLTSGIGLLFMIIVLLGVLAISYIDKLADDTKNILSDNNIPDRIFFLSYVFCSLRGS